MSRSKTPTNILDLKGAFKTNPERKRPSEPEGITWDTKAPEYFTEHEAGVWDELVRITPKGVLKQSDAPTVEVCARLLSAFRLKDINLSVIQRLTISLGKLGLSPSDRAGIVVDKPTKNKFADD